jgi:3-oxoacyl-[acyl-carrier-protein] synthase III
VPASAVLGCGRHFPSRKVTSDDLARDLGATAAELTEQTGIPVRYYAEPGIGPSDLARDASAAALAAAGLAPTDVDLIVFATMTPDIAFPGSGCFLQHKLGCDTVGAIDVRAQCAGFLFALATADRFVRAGSARRVLVACAEVHSTALELAPRAAAVTPRFGDGAGALILGARSEPGVIATVLHSDPSDLEQWWCEFPASRHHPARMTRAALEAGRHYYQLDADALRPRAEAALADVTAEVLERADVPVDRVALFLFHYLDPRVARAAAARAGLPAERVVATAEIAGHVAAAGIPIALADALAAGRLRTGDLVCCTAFGAGISWGGVLLRV